MPQYKFRPAERQSLRDLNDLKTYDEATQIPLSLAGGTQYNVDATRQNRYPTDSGMYCMIGSHGKSEHISEKADMPAKVKRDQINEGEDTGP